MYVRAPVITVSTGIALAKALSEACPQDASPGVKKALKHLVALAAKAKTDLADRNRVLGVFTDEDSRDLDNEADRAWGGFRLRLTGLTMLPADEYPRARRAAQLDALLFAEGTEFLKLDYAAQSTAMGALLERIATDGLQKEIDDLAGAEFLKAIKSVQPRYETMVTERLRRDKAVGQNLLETTRGMQEAIVNYAAKVIGTIEHDDPTTTEAARVALLPIANLRDAFAARQARAAVSGGAGDAADGEDTGADGATGAGGGEGAATAVKGAATGAGKKAKPA
jgi:hypothetical protein